MCTVLTLRRPGHAWPLIMGANRDEMVTRAALPPARHWPDRPGVLAGRDLTAGGTWLGLNDAGVIAAVMNRVGSLGPAPGARSRGELPLIALDHATAESAARAVARLDGGLYRAFNLVVADAGAGFWLARRAEDPAITVAPLPEGLAMLTARELNDPASPRIRHHLPRAAALPAPDPDRDDWSAWEDLLASRESGGGDPREAMSIAETDGFATVSSSLLALSAAGRPPVWLYADGPPDRASFQPLALD